MELPIELPIVDPIQPRKHVAGGDRVKLFFTRLDRPEDFPGANQPEHFLPGAALSIKSAGCASEKSLRVGPIGNATGNATGNAIGNAIGNTIGNTNRKTGPCSSTRE